jgi:hypothetical protein
MRLIPQLSALAAALLLTAGAAQAQTQFFSFQGVLTDGPLTGQAFSGSFSVNPSALPPGGDAEFPLLTFSMLLAGNTYTLATADLPPTAVYAAGSFAGLAYLDADAPNPAVRPLVAFIPGFDNFAGAYLAYTAAPVGGVDSGFGSYAVTAVPEPASVALLLAGLGLVGAAARRRQAA